MTFAQILGAALIALPFLAIFILGLRTLGLGATLCVFGLTAVMIAIIAAGSYLLTGDLS